MSLRRGYSTAPCCEGWLLLGTGKHAPFCTNATAEDRVPLQVVYSHG